MPEYKPETIEAAGANVLSEPLTYLNLAHRYTADACRLHCLAFGVVGSAVLSSSYETSRSAIEQNLKSGGELLQEMVKSLAKVAAAMRHTEKANTIDPARKVDRGYESPDGGGNAKTVFEGASLAMMFDLATVNYAIACVLGASSVLAPTAIISTVLWALFTPDDSALSTAEQGWGNAKTQLDGIGLDDAVSGMVWDDSAREAFNAWLKRVNSEIEKNAAAAEKNQSTLQEIIKNVDQLQLTFFVFAVTSLALIIGYWACSGIPVLNAIAQILANIQGALLAASAATTVAAVGALLLAAWEPVKSMLSQQDDFAQLQAHLGGGTGFKATDLKIEWTTPTVT